MPKSLNERLYKLTLAAMFLAVALILPFLTGQIQPIAKKFCLMHIPVLLCGFFCGPWYAMMVGAVAPLLRFVMFSMPPVMPTGLAMSFELAAYGFLAGWLYRILPRKKKLYLCLTPSGHAGRAYHLGYRQSFPLRHTEFSFHLEPFHGWCLRR